MAHVSKGKYFPNSDLFSASMGHNPSCLWRSLLLGRDLLQAAVRWIMGDGCSVRVFRDPWIPRPHLFKPITRPRPDEEEMRVADLMDATSWRLDRVEKVFWNVDTLDVCSIPLGYRSRPDSLVWHYDSKGSYTVKTGYRLAMKLRFEAGGSDGNARCLWWRKLWKAHVPNKAKIHACFSKQHLIRQGMNISPLCPLCHVEFETTSRALWYCGLTKGGMGEKYYLAGSENFLW